MPALYGGGICGDLIQRAERGGPYSAQYDNQSPLKLAAANAIASLVPDDQLSENFILPEAFNPEVAEVVSKAVKENI